MEKIEYTALKYYNSCVSEECLYVGMLFNNITTNTRKFKYIRNYNRLASFDDEISIDFFKAYLKSIKDEVECNIFNFDKSFDLADYIKPFVNELRFSKIKVQKTDDPEFIENISKLFLRFDYDKKERLSKDKEKKYIKQVLKSSKITFHDKPALGCYAEPIPYDFSSENYGIKIFTFKEKELKRMILNAKAWSYTAKEMESNKKSIFIYDQDIENSKEFDIIINILKENAYKVLPLESGIDYISSLS